MKRQNKAYTQLNAKSSKITKEDRNIVLSSVKIDGLSLKYASIELKSDREIVSAAVTQNGLAIQYACYELRLDSNIKDIAVKQNSNALKLVPDKLKNEREVLLSNVKQKAWALKCASIELRGDKEIVLAAVQQKGLTLQYASKEFRKDKEIVLAAVQQNSRALFLASEELKEDKRFLIECYKKNKDTIFNNFIKQFDKLENRIFNYSFIKKNVDILDLVENKEQLCEYLLKNKKYRTIYDNEDISNYIRDKYKIIILSLDDIKPITDDNTVVVTEEDIKKEYENRYIGLQVIFID